MNQAWSSIANRKGDGEKQKKGEESEKIWREIINKLPLFPFRVLRGVWRENVRVSGGRRFRYSVRATFNRLRVYVRSCKIYDVEK